MLVPSLETEKHMVFKCTKYKDLRSDFLTKIKTKINLNFEDENNFLTSLMTTENYDIINIFQHIFQIAFSYVMLPKIKLKTYLDLKSVLRNYDSTSVCVFFFCFSIRVKTL